MLPEMDDHQYNSLSKLMVYDHQFYLLLVNRTLVYGAYFIHIYECF